MEMYQISIDVEQNAIRLRQGDVFIVISHAQARLIGKHLIALAMENDIETIKRPSDLSESEKNMIRKLYSAGSK